MIQFNVPPYTGNEVSHISRAIERHKICGDGEYTKKCSEWLTNRTGAYCTLLTPSCTHALEMSALLSEIKPGDEIIMPSYTFVSTANAFVLRGAKIVFVDIRPDTMNIDEKIIPDAITPKTKAIVPVHYAGIACEMKSICEIAAAFGLDIIEDAAQAMMSAYQNKPLGTFGRFGCLSFHETKNYSMGEGGALFLNKSSDVPRAEIIREKGTDRSRFFRGQVNKYSWIDCGSSYLPSELNAAYLYPQLESADKINRHRLRCFAEYHRLLSPLQQSERLELPYVPKECSHNGHMFYIKTRNIDERTSLISHLRKYEIGSVFHYIPLHTSPAGCKFGRFFGDDIHTTKESKRLLRLPMHCDLSLSDVAMVCEKIFEFYSFM